MSDSVPLRAATACLRALLRRTWWQHTVWANGRVAYSAEFRRMCAAAGVEPDSFANAQPDRRATARTDQAVVGDSQ